MEHSFSFLRHVRDGTKFFFMAKNRVGVHKCKKLCVISTCKSFTFLVQKSTPIHKVPHTHIGCIIRLDTFCRCDWLPNQFKMIIYVAETSCMNLNTVATLEREDTGNTFKVDEFKMCVLESKFT